MHLTYSRMLSYSITCMLIPLVLTIYLNLMLLCLKCLKIFAYNFPLPGPSYSPILAWSLAILDGVLHKYITWWISLCFLNSCHGPALSFHGEVNMKELEFLSSHCICFTFSSFHSLISSESFSELKCRISELPIHRLKTLVLLGYASNEDTPLDIFLICVSGSTFKHSFL